MSVMPADAGSTPAISTKYNEISQSLRWLAFFMPEFLIRITASSADSRGKRKLMIYNKKKASNCLEAF